MTPGETGFLLDLDRCTGCHACALACSTENDLGWGKSWRHIVDFNPSHRNGVPSFHLSLACNHCQEAPCATACPALAIDHDPYTNAVIIDPDRCMGCKYCSWACPYDAPRFDEQAGVMGKCTLCSHRSPDTGRQACVEACPTAALDYGVLSGVADVPGFPQTAARPRVGFSATGRPLSGPETTWQLPSELLAAYIGEPQSTRSRIGLHSEWPLYLFTLIAVALVSWVAGSAVRSSTPSPLVFASASGVAIGASLLHLGRKSRAWRAILNLRRSWLSREIVCFGGFVGLSLGSMLMGWSLWPAAVLGALALFCIDRVYDPVRPARSRPLHSADTVLSALVLLASIMGGGRPSFGFGGVKLVLYLRRLWLARRPLPAAHALLAGARVGLGFAAPFALWILAAPSWEAWAIVSFALGEAIDRAQFYEELRIVTPAAQAREDAASWPPGGVHPRLPQAWLNNDSVAREADA